MKIGIYGLGRFGSFWASCLSKAGCEVIAYSKSRHEVPAGVRLATEDEVLTAPVLIFNVSISSFDSVLEKTASRIGRSTIVMDTCSVKSYPAKWMENRLPKEIYKIATHPMFGPDSGKNGVENLPLVMCELSKRDERYQMIKDLFLSMHIRVIEMTPMEHDKEAAFSQGITHLLGRTLDRMNTQPSEIATKGYKSLQVIKEQTCNDPMQLFYDLQHYNPFTREMRHAYRNALLSVCDELDDLETLK